MAHPSDPRWAGYLSFRRAALRELAAAQGLEPVDEPGLFGAVGTDGEPAGALVVVDPSAAVTLDDLLQRTSPEFVAVVEPAQALLPVVTDAGWSVATAQGAMALPDLAELPQPSLPSAYRLHRVDLVGDPDGVSLEEALLVDVLYGGSSATVSLRDLPAEAEHLRHLPGVTLFAAVDPHDLCVATAGTRVVGTAAVVSAVATIPAARGQGLAFALTAAALRAAAAAGATAAYLDAAGGLGVYRGLGFCDLGTVTSCRQPAAG